MKTLDLFAFNTLFLINIMASGMQRDSTTLHEVMSLVESYHQEGCPQDVVDRFTQLYKNNIRLSDFSLPFTSFTCIPIKSYNNYLSIALHPDLHYADNMTISMLSDDGGCVVFLDVSALGIVAGNPAATQDVRKVLLEDIITNSIGRARYEVQKTDRADFAGVYDKQVKIYTQDSWVAQNCNADTVYVCSLPNRKNIGFKTDVEGAGKEFNAMTDYKAAYKVVLKRNNHFPVKMLLFCKKNSDKVLMQYLEAISKSVKFGTE